MTVPTMYATTDADSQSWLTPGQAFLLPATSWARPKHLARGGMASVYLPDDVETIAVDPGGFQAMARSGGQYPFYPFRERQYVEWLRRLPVTPEWAATMDLPAVGLEARWSRAYSISMADSLRIVYRDAPWAWVMTMQGTTLEEYAETCRRMRHMVDAERRHNRLKPGWRVGVGTLKGRKGPEVLEVVKLVSEALDHPPLHLWGVTYQTLVEMGAHNVPGNVVSYDTSAWTGRFKSDLEKHKAAANGGEKKQRQVTYHERLPRYRRMCDDLFQRRPANAAD